MNKLLFIEGLSGVSGIILLALGIIVFLVITFFVVLSMFYKKIPQGKAIVRTGVGGSKVEVRTCMNVIPVFHKMETMDISMTTSGSGRPQDDGLALTCNLGADMKVA